MTGVLNKSYRLHLKQTLLVKFICDPRAVRLACIPISVPISLWILNLFTHPQNK